MSDARLIRGDCLDVLPTLKASSVDSVCTDPPAGISFMSKRFDTFAGRGAFIDFLASVFRECLRVLRPGGYAFVWALPRTSHWTATAIEDAGFEIRDKVYHHFGQGFPKGKGCLKPSTEEWILARKPGPRVLPLPGLDECRVGFRESRPLLRGGSIGYGGSEAQGVVQDGGLGRYPPNLLLCHSALCRRVGTKKVRTGTAVCRNTAGTEKNRNGVYSSGLPRQEEDAGYADADGLETVEAWECADECPIRLLSLQSGERKSGDLLPGHKRGDGPNVPYGGGGVVYRAYGGDSGTAARFFPQFTWSAADDVPFRYCPKASRRERNEGCEGLPEQDWVQWQTANGSSGKPSSLSEGRSTKHRNIHPTVKPLALMRWLVRLITPAGGLCLDPFLGSGTTGVACLKEGRRFVGIENDTEHGYFQIAQARLAQAETETLVRVA